jgi:Spy/CpxP family protein refolding chaperone
MKLAKRSLLTAVALGMLVAMAPFTRAQDNNSDNNNSSPKPPATGQRARRGGGQNQFQRIADQLKLTDEQKTKLQPIFQEEATKLRDVRQDTNLSAEQKRDKSREIRDQYNAKIKPVLTADQYDQFKKLRQGGGGRPPRGPGNPATPAPNSGGSDQK